MSNRCITKIKDVVQPSHRRISQLKPSHPIGVMGSFRSKGYAPANNHRHSRKVGS